jgi:ribosomal protein S18 acetylase RimI-like enzyme
VHPDPSDLPITGAEGTAGQLEVVIGVATTDDVAALAPLYRDFMLHESAVPPADVEIAERLERLLASESDQVLLARTHGLAVGYLQLRYFWSVWRPRRDAFIEDLFVTEAFRARRIGEQLLAGALSQARGRDVERICLDTNENNARARSLYERLGFRNQSTAWQGGRQLFYSLVVGA